MPPIYVILLVRAFECGVDNIWRSCGLLIFSLLAVSKNPNSECNPQLGEDNIIGIVLGVGLTTISLAWTGWSSTAEAKISGST
jgi:hypothetical protein